MKRYDLETHGRPYMQREEMTERPDGEWVRYADVAPLIEALRLVHRYIHGECTLVRAEEALEEALAKVDGEK